MRARAGLVLMLGLWAGGTSAQPLPRAPDTAIETATGMRYVVLKAAPVGAQTVLPSFIRYRARIHGSAGKTAADADQDGVQSGAFKRLAQTQPGLARAILSTPIGETRRWWFTAGAEPPQVIDLTVLGNYDPTPAPKDVAAPPAAAIRTDSGLAYQALKRGPGGPKPVLSSTIEIHYSGWTTDGRLFDSSVQRDEHAVFPLAQLIPGWQEGLQLMSPGDSYRFWIPGPLAYDNLPPRPGAPRGMLVFDVTLYSIE